MSMEDDDDDARQYRCFNKYQQIVKQVVLLDELTDSIEPVAKISKGKMKSKGKRTSNSANSCVSKTKEEGFDQVMVHTLSTFLHDLNPKKPLLNNTNPLHDIDQQSSSTSQLAPSTTTIVSRQPQK